MRIRTTVRTDEEYNDMESKITALRNSTGMSHIAEMDTMLRIDWCGGTEVDIHLSDWLTIMDLALVGLRKTKGRK